MITDATHLNRSSEIVWGRRAKREAEVVTEAHKTENYTERYKDKYENNKEEYANW